jgi:hypothetical protein
MNTSAKYPIDVPSEPRGSVIEPLLKLRELRELPEDARLSWSDYKSESRFFLHLSHFLFAS